MKGGPVSRVSPDKTWVGNKGPWTFVGANRCNCSWVSSNHPSPAEADRSLPARRPLRVGLSNLGAAPAALGGAQLQLSPLPPVSLSNYQNFLVYMQSK